MAQLSISLLTDHVIKSLATPPTVVHIANIPGHPGLAAVASALHVYTRCVELYAQNCIK